MPQYIYVSEILDESGYSLQKQHSWDKMRMICSTDDAVFQEKAYGAVPSGVIWIKMWQYVCGK